MVIIFSFLFLVVEKKSQTPLINYRLFKRVEFLYGCVYRFLSNLIFYVSLYVFSLYLEARMDLSPTSTGLSLAPATLGIMLFSFMTGFLLKRCRPLPLIASGFIIYIIGFLFFLSSISNNYKLFFYVNMILFGLAYGISSPSMLAYITIGVDRFDMGLANGIFYMFGMLGGSLGLSFLALIYESDLRHHQLESALSVKDFYQATYFLLSILALSLLIMIIQVILTKKGQKRCV
jgi:MFS family permease